MDSAALNKQAIACAKHYMGKTAWPTMLLTAAVVAALRCHACPVRQWLPARLGRLSAGRGTDVYVLHPIA